MPQCPVHFLPPDLRECRDSRARASTRGCRCRSQRGRGEDGARAKGLLGSLGLAHPPGASLHPSVVQGFGATLGQVATLWETEQDKSPLCEGET